MSMPKEPRQLMINLMYLVLTAMLALNVSSEILHAFKTINQSISASNASIEDKNTKLYAALEEQQKQAGQEARVKPFNDKAKQVKNAAADMIKYLNDLKERVITESGGREANGDIKREDNIDASTLLLVEKKEGNTLKKKLEELRTMMISVVDNNVQKQLSNELPIKVIEPQKTDNNPQGDWSTGYFYNMPTMAVITLLSKFQNDVRNSEAIIVNQLAKEAGDIQVKFDEIQAIAVPKTSYALAGQKVEASIMLAAYNKAINPTVSSSSGRVTKVENGVASWEVTAGGVGLQTVRGQVSLNMGNRTETRPYEFQYMVGSTGASIQLDKMNVFYIGVPNPITVTAAGYSLEDVSVSIPGATVAAGAAKGQFIVTADKPGKVTAAINAKEATGTKQVGAMEVRVKYIPDPVAEVGGKIGGSMPSNQFKVQRGIVAALKAFDFDARFQVTEFQYSMLPKRGELIGPFTVRGPLFETNKQVQDAINRCKPGDKIFLEEIRAKGPDGRTRPLNPISLTLQ
ncbi:gliding motility protein GldM [Polluticoccus soli]|uniref:type IX secretion system motor protein PorM/GldM n=1 Tax=Polluticoccus soli TaxID=3034150 RepID=UPI0023E28B6D|nr:gliding motility protein GldM [Flavipsychrobacter sp. JY13-12]